MAKSGAMNANDPPCTMGSLGNKKRQSEHQYQTKAFTTQGFIYVHKTTYGQITWEVLWASPGVNVLRTN